MSSCWEKPLSRHVTRVRPAELRRICPAPAGWTKFSCGASGLRNCAVSGPHPQDGLNSVVARPVCGAAPDQARTRRTNSIQLCASSLRNCPAQLPRIRSATAVRTVIDQSYRQVWRKVGADLHNECDCCANQLIRGRIWHRSNCCLGRLLG